MNVAEIKRNFLEILLCSIFERVLLRGNILFVYVNFKSITNTFRSQNRFRVSRE